MKSMNEIIDELDKKEKERIKARQEEIKKGCSKCSQLDEHFGCNKCKGTIEN